MAPHDICLCRLVMTLLVVIHYAACPCASTTGPPSMKLKTFVKLTSGVFSNSLEVHDDDIENQAIRHDLIIGDLLPVKLVTFNSSITFLFREIRQNRFLRLQILVISEDNTGIIRVSVYDLPNIESYRNDTFDLRILDKLKLSDYTTKQECEVMYSQIEPTVFLGTWPDCSRYKPVLLPHMLSCSGFSIIILPGTRETGSRVPYKESVVHRYPLSVLSDVIGDLDSMPNPCDFH